jgi:hypothetical protein
MEITDSTVVTGNSTADLRFQKADISAGGQVSADSATTSQQQITSGAK